MAGAGGVQNGGKLATKRLSSPLSCRQTGTTDPAGPDNCTAGEFCHVLRRPGETKSSKRYDQRVARKTCDRGSESRYARLFQQGISNTKEKWEAALDYQPVVVESVVSTHDVQNGSRPCDQGSNSSAPVCNQHRLDRRLLAHSGRAQALEVPGISSRFETVHVSGSAVWAEHGASRVLGGNEGFETLGSADRSSVVSIPRRLAPSAPRCQRTRAADSYVSQEVSGTRSLGQSKEVRAGPSAAHRLSRRPSGLRQRHDLRHRGAFCRHLRQGAGSHQTRDRWVSSASFSSRSSHSYRKDCAVRAMPPAKSAEPSVSAFEGKGETPGPSRLDKRLVSGLTLVDRAGPRAARRAHGGALARPPGSNRRVNDRLGRVLPRHCVTRQLVAESTEQAHQRARDDDSLTSVRAAEGAVSAEVHSLSHRQSDCGLLCQQTGGDTIATDAFVSTEAVAVGRGSSGDVDGASHQGQPQRGGGLGLEDRCSSEHRVVLHQERLPEPGSTVTVGATQHRSFCEQPEPSAAVVLQSLSGRPSVCDRRPYDTVARQEGLVRLPTDDHLGSCPQKDSGLTALKTAAGSPEATRSPVVSDPSADALHVIVEVEPSAGRSHATALAPLPSESRSFQSVPVLHQFQALKDQGFSDAVLAQVKQANAKSTSRVYESHWKLFCGWCKDHGLKPEAATGVAVCDFFLYLHHKRRLKVKTIECYRAALAYKLKRLSGYELCECDVINDLLRSFKREQASIAPAIVRWDIAAVLDFLQTGERRTDIASPKLLTFKMTFLLALALGKRRSEIHALQREGVEFSADGSTVTILPSCKFVSKTHLNSKGLGVLGPVTIPALQGDKGVTELCPVRTLRHYLAVTDDIRSPGQRRLIISHVDSIEKDISMQTVSRYIKRAILLTYANLESKSEKFVQFHYNITAHQVRHVAHSLGQLGAVPLTDLIRTGGWTTPRTFIRHYLHDLSPDTVKNLRSFGSFVAIEKVFKAD